MRDRPPYASESILSRQIIYNVKKAAKFKQLPFYFGLLYDKISEEKWDTAKG
jgi:hypothetical protein